MGDLADFRSEMLLDGLDRGEARVALKWVTPTGTRGYLSHPAPGEALPNLFEGWAVQANLDCMPDATTSIHLEGPAEGPAPLTHGTYPLSRFGFDVPSLEQSSDSESTMLDGQVVIQSVNDDAVTGYLDGWASADLKSNFGQRPLDITVEVTAVAFKEVRLLGDYPSVE